MGDIGTEPISVVYVVDDDPCMLQAIETLVRTAGYEVQTFPSGHEFLASSVVDAPTCLVLDVGLPGLNGLELQQELATRGLQLPIIFVTGHGDIPMSVRAIKAGAIEFLLKPFREDDLLNAIGKALERSRALRSERALIDGLRQRFQLLTPRERQVLQLVVRGMLNKQIASALGISEVTVKIHRGHVMQKTRAGSLADLVRMAERFENHSTNQ